MSRVRTVVAAEIILLVGLLALVVGAWLIERGFGLDQPLALGHIASAAVAACPALLWLGYFQSQDRLEPTPKHHVVSVFLVGAFLAGPLAQYVIDGTLAPHPASAADLDPLSAARLVRAFLVIAVIQELATFAVVRYSVYRTSEFDEPIDGMIYMTAAALGYASYLTFIELRAGGGEVFLSVAAARSVGNALAHACFAAVLGYVLGVAKFTAAPPLRRGLRLAGGFAIAVALNGQYAIVSGALATHGLDTTPWRTIAYGFGFASAVFIAVSLLIRRLVALSPRRTSLEMP